MSFSYTVTCRNGVDNNHKRYKVFYFLYNVPTSILLGKLIKIEYSCLWGVAVWQCQVLAVPYAHVTVSTNINTKKGLGSTLLVLLCCTYLEYISCLAGLAPFSEEKLLPVFDDKITSVIPLRNLQSTYCCNTCLAFTILTRNRHPTEND